MTNDTRPALPYDGKGKKNEELLFLYSPEYGLGYPSGHRTVRAVFFARWRNFLWKVHLQTVAAHKETVDHNTGHPACGHGSMIVLPENPHTELLRLIIKAQEGADFEQERELVPFVVASFKGRGGDARIIVLDRTEFSWDDAEEVARELIYIHRGDPALVRCIWRDRDANEELAAWQRAQSDHIDGLRKPLRERAEFVSPSGVERRAEAWKMSLEEAREHLREQGYSEDKQGNFIRKYPPFNEGERDVFMLQLLAYAKKRAYKGPLYLSAHAWPELEFVASGKRFQMKFKGERAWYGYFREEKLVICIPVADRANMKGYSECTVGGDPDFFGAMDEIRPTLSDDVNAADAALKEKGWTYDRTPDGECSAQSGRSADEPPNDNEETQT